MQRTHAPAVERRLAGLSLPSLVDEVYPSHCAPVPELVSRATLACAGGGLVDAEAVEAVRAGAARLLRSAEEVFRAGSADDFVGCLRIWEVGDSVVAPLLEAHGRVAVLLVDAMRADLASSVVPLVAEALPGRAVLRRWAVVPAPTRTAEAVAAMALGRRAGRLGPRRRPPRSACPSPISATRPTCSWAPTATTAPATCGRCSPRARPSPWPDGRYVHGGTSLEECVVPVVSSVRPDRARPEPPLARPPTEPRARRASTAPRHGSP